MRWCLHAWITLFIYLIIGSILGSIISPAYSAIRRATDDIPLESDYFYRLIERASAISPSKYFTDNIKPVSMKEAVIFFNPDEEMARLFGRNERLDKFLFYSQREIKEKEYKGHNFLFNPLKRIILSGVHSKKEDALINSNFGEQFHGNYYLTLSGIGNMYLKDLAMLSYELRLTHEEENTKLEFFRYKFKKGFKHVSFIYAKDNLLVGPGYFGKLILSDNTKPENMCLLKTEVPYNWGILGKFRWYMWHIWYDDADRANKDPMMLGVRFSLRPFDEFELNISRISYYSQEYEKMKDYWHLFTGKYENSSREGDKWDVDQLISFESSLYLPFIKKVSPFLGGKLYTEHTWEDFYGKWQERENINEPDFVDLVSKSFIYGLFLTTGRVDARVEYAKTTRNAYANNNFFPEGYSDDGYIIGHYLGGDSKGYFGEIYFELTDDTHISIDGGYISRGIHLEEQQIEKSYGAGIRYIPTPSLECNFTVHYSTRNKKDMNDSPVYYTFIDEKESETFFFFTMIMWL